MSLFLLFLPTMTALLLSYYKVSLFYSSSIWNFLKHFLKNLSVAAVHLSASMIHRRIKLSIYDLPLWVYLWLCTISSRNSDISTNFSCTKESIIKSQWIYYISIKVKRKTTKPSEWEWEECYYICDLEYAQFTFFK